MKVYYNEYEDKYPGFLFIACAMPGVLWATLKDIIKNLTRS